MRKRNPRQDGGIRIEHGVGGDADAVDLVKTEGGRGRRVAEGSSAASWSWFFPAGPVMLLLLVVAFVNLTANGTGTASRYSSSGALFLSAEERALLQAGVPESHPRRQDLKWRRRGGSPPCLIVYHIPKTGGTTLEHYLSNLGQELQWDYHNWDDFSRKNPGRGPFRAKKPKYGGDMRNRVIHEGHLTPHFEKVTNTHMCAKLTVMREPVERVVSAFYFHKRENHSLDEWQNCLHTHCWLDYEYRNDVTRRFAARTQWWSSLERGLYLADRRDGEAGNERLLNLTEADMESAQEKLMALDAVCFLDNLKGCVNRFVRDRFGLDTVQWPSENLNRARRSKQDVTDELRREIADANALDVRLYEWALRTFRFEDGASSSSTSTE